MAIRFSITVDTSDKETAPVRKFLLALAVELIRATERIDGQPKTDVTLGAVADVLEDVPATDKLQR